MSGERFDSGAVLSRARPVLTFSTLAGAESAGPARADATPPPVSWHEATAARAGGAFPGRPPALPVIPRIVRRTMIDDRALLRPIAQAAHVAKRAGLGTLVFVVLGLGTLGAIAGLGMRSLAEEGAVTQGAEAPAAAMAHTSDARASEHLLARAPLAVRTDHVEPARVDPPVHADPPRPSRPAPATVSHPAPSHLAFASSHAAAKKRSSAPALARR